MTHTSSEQKNWMNVPAKNEGEGDLFLPMQKNESFIKNSSSSKEKSSSKSCCCQCCTCKCCCIAVAIIFIILLALLLIGYFLIRSKLTGSASSEDSELWHNQLTDSTDLEKISGIGNIDDLLAGSYRLVSYDENYGAYLKSLGIPFFAVPIILGASEVLNVAIKGDTWRIDAKNDLQERQTEFTLGVQFEHSWGRNDGIMHTTCIKEDKHIVSCTSEERVKGWDMISKMIFSPGKGFINERNFLTKDISARKYYQKIGGETLMEAKDPNAGLIEVGGGDTDPFNSNDSDDSFLDDNSKQEKNEDDDFWDEEWKK